MNDSAEVQRLEAEWKQRHQEWKDLHDLYFSSGSSVPIKRPARVLTPEALEEIELAKQGEEAAYRRYLEASRQ